MKLTYNCPKCGKPAKLQAEFPVGDMINYVYQCGHLELVKRDIPEIKQEPKYVPEFNYTEIRKEFKTIHNSNIKSSGFGRAIMYMDAPEPTHKELYEDLDNWANEGGLLPEIPRRFTHPSFYSVDGKDCAYEYQQDGVIWLEKTQVNGLIADEQGLGKTIQALIAIKRNMNILGPIGIVVKGSLIFQWHAQFAHWVSNNLGDCMPVTKRSHLMPGFKCYIFSMDMLAKKDFVKQLIDLNLKTLIIDECQLIKDEGSKRTRGLIELIKMCDIKYKIALSGTPIKNYADEYFTILNILAPMHFPDKARFKSRWLDYSGKRINQFMLDEFKDLTSRWILRRNKVDVLTNLPPLTRDYQIIEIDDPNIKNSYNHAIDLFKNWLNDQGKTGIDSPALLGWLAQLRAITGQAKCKNALEWTKDFIESTEESLAIGIQHHSVRDTLYIMCKHFGFNPLKLSGEDNVYRKNDIVRSFTNGDNRLLIINSIAGGVGLNLQTCSNALVLERQWNSADEEQFESRFHRNGQKQAVTITYMIAKNTIDEFFHDMVQRKRKILDETGIGNGFDLNTDIDSLRELANKVVSSKI